MKKFIWLWKKKKKEEKTNLINNKQRFRKGYKSDNFNFNYEKENKDLSKLNMINHLIICFYRIIKENEKKFELINLMIKSKNLYWKNINKNK